MSPGQLNIREILNVFYTYVKIEKIYASYKM